MGATIKATLAVFIMAGGIVTAQPSTAQTYPTKPVRIVVQSSAGGPPDILARMIGPKLSERWGQPVVTDNRPGAGGTLSAAQVAKAAPDGYTLLFAGANFPVSAALLPNLPYDPIKDFAGVTQIAFPTAVLVVAPALGVKSVKELIAMAQAKPGKILFSASAAGSAAHLNGERVRLAAGIKAVHVGFKGQPEALIEVVAGRVHYSVLGLGVVLPVIKDGRLVPLAVLSPKRSPLLPDVPAVAEVLPRIERSESSAILAPAKTPRPILDQISREVGRILDLPDIKERMYANGFVPAPTTPEEQDTIRREQIESLSKFAVAAGLKAK